MKTLLLCIAALVLTTVSLRAQYDPIEPLGISNPELVSSFEADIEIQSKTSSGSGRIGWWVVAWRTETDAIEYTIDVDSITRGGLAEVYAGYTVEELFDYIGARTVVVGIDSAYAICSGGGSTGVTLARCVFNVYDGYSANGCALVSRGYSYTCSAVTLTGTTGNASCGGGSERTSGASGLE